LNRDLADALLARTGQLWNVYGPTETTIWSAAWKVSAGDIVPIGQALANTQLYVLDNHLRLLPVGAVGELCIGGLGLAEGYLNQPELTATSFVPNPFAPAERIYKTGDLGRRLPDGAFECLGRKDDQVKIRGFRIEPGEIEAALRQHPLIRDALVVPKPNKQAEPGLVAYLLWKNGSTDIHAVRDFLSGRLPAYMVPQRFMTLEVFPLTANGKADRQRLPSPDLNPETRQQFVAPHGLEQEQLAQIWKEVLGIGRVGINDNFFEIGGDSLSATRAFARINRALGANLSLRHIFEHPTIAGLADLLAKGVGANGASKPPIRPIARRRRPGAAAATGI
jgi:aryl carrier-like protein